MFASIRRHQTWLLSVIIGVMIVSMVVFFTGPSKFSGRGGGGGDYGSVGGQAISQTEYLAARREALILFYFGYQRFPRSGEADLDQEAVQRVAFVRRLKQMNVAVTDAQVAAQVVTIFKDPRTKTFSQPAYDDFVRQTLGSQGISEDDLRNFFKHQLGMRYLQSLEGLSGSLAAPRSAEGFYRQDKEQAVTSAVFFQPSNYLSKVVVDANEVTQYFRDNQAAYRIPEKRQVYYLAFDRLAYMTEAAKQMAAETNLTQIIDKAYDDRKPGEYLDDKGQPLSEALAKERIKNDLRDRMAMRAAYKAATDLANELFAQEPLTITNLLNMANARKLTVKETEPFTQEDGPKQIAVSEVFMREAFKRTPQEPFASPVLGETAVYLMGLKQVIDSRAPALDEVKAHVTEDYKLEKAGLLAGQASTEFFAKVSAGLAKGQSFASLCAGAGIKPVDVPAFTRSVQSLPGVDHVVPLREYVRAAFETGAGHATRKVPGREASFIVYVKERIPVSPEKMNAEIGEYVQNIRETREGYAYQDWARRFVTEERIMLPPKK